MQRLRSYALIFPLLLLLTPALLAETPPADKLTAEEAKIAEELASEAVAELPGRIFHVQTELLREKPGKEGEPPARKALVAHYAYEGGLGILTTVDLEQREVIEVERVRGLPVPLSEEEFAMAKELALEDPLIQEALGRQASEVEAEVQVIRPASEESPYFGQRVVRMMFLLGEDYLSWPIAIVNLSERTVELESDEPPAGARHPDELETRAEEGSVDSRLGEAIQPPVPDLEVEERIQPGEDILPPTRSCCPQHTRQASGGEVIQEFPPSGTAETAWKVRFAHATSKGLYITGAWFRKGPGEPWMRVVWDARLSDIFVPYHSGSQTLRYLDLSQFKFDLVKVQNHDLGCCGKKADDYVVKEVRDRGILWKNDEKGRRGHELVLWATLDAANYNYVIKYVFRDDGMISFRLGATAQNLPGHEWEAHMHNGLWRIDVDLGGFPNDSALLTRHDEPFGSLSANDKASPFNGGKEGFADWEALEFTGLRVQETRMKNGHGKPVAYDLMPLRRGRARHQESYTHHDFWVTRYRSPELFYTQLPTYVGNSESVVDTDVVLWHMSPVHHLPRQEDGQFVGGTFQGVALVMWGGVDLRPRDLFDDTPLHP